MSALSILSSDDEITVTIPREGMAEGDLDRYLESLEANFIAMQSRFTDDDAWSLSEAAKSDWWSRNESRIKRKLGLDQS